jgi:hypothetical protein
MLVAVLCLKRKVFDLRSGCIGVDELPPAQRDAGI